MQPLDELRSATASRLSQNLFAPRDTRATLSVQAFAEVLETYSEWVLEALADLGFSADKIQDTYEEWLELVLANDNVRVCAERFPALRVLGNLRVMLTGKFPALGPNATWHELVEAELQEWDGVIETAAESNWNWQKTCAVYLRNQEIDIALRERVHPDIEYERVQALAKDTYRTSARNVLDAVGIGDQVSDEELAADMSGVRDRAFAAIKEQLMALVIDELDVKNGKVTYQEAIGAIPEAAGFLPFEDFPLVVESNEFGTP